MAKFSVGANAEGLTTLDNKLREVLVVDPESQLDSILNQATLAVKEVWQGRSCDEYLKDLERAIEIRKESIEAEYADLQQKLVGIGNDVVDYDNESYTSTL